MEIDMDNLKEGGAVAFMSILAMQSTVMNVVMLNLNLVIPVHPFPGARALVALLILCGTSPFTAGLVTAICGILVGLLAFWIGLFLFLINYTIIALCLGSLACFTIFSGVRLLRMTLSGVVQEHVLFQRSCYQSGKRKGAPSPCSDQSISTIL